MAGQLTAGNCGAGGGNRLFPASSAAVFPAESMATALKTAGAAGIRGGFGGGGYVGGVMAVDTEAGYGGG